MAEPMVSLQWPNGLITAARESMAKRLMKKADGPKLFVEPKAPKVEKPSVEVKKKDKE